MNQGSRRRSAARAPDRVVWIEGELMRGAEATLSVFDRGARDGGGLFETLRVYRRHPFQWTRHLERLVVSAAELGFPVPPSPRTRRDALDQVLGATGLSDAVVRLTVTRGIPSGGRGRRTRTSAWVEAEPLETRLWRGTRAGGASLIYSRRAFESGPLGRHKTTSRLAYHLALEEARAARVDEALLVSPAGWVLEGSASNLFVVERGRVLTPPLALGILPGITRTIVLEQCAALGIPSEEHRLSTADLERAEEVFVTNSVQEVVPVCRLEGRELPAPAIAVRLRAAYSGLVDSAGEA